MTRYMLARVLQALLTLLVVSILAFALVRLIPGDPARLILGPQRSTPENVAELRHQLGLDRSVVAQYLDFIRGAATFDFGRSATGSKEPVADAIGRSLWPSLWLILYAYAVAVVFVVPLAVLAAVRRNRPVDHAIRVSATIGFATPPFLSGLVLIVVVAVSWELLPVSGYDEGVIRSLTLPAITVAIFFAPALLRVLRSSLVQTLSDEFIESARARGLSRGRVLFKHALWNSVLPTLTVMGLSLGALLSGAVIVENVFAIPGIGSLLISSVGGRDYPTVQALILVIAAVVVVSNLITDLLYTLIDPRIRL